MSINKQTVWLITMLSIMVVLSAYYIVTGPVEPVGQEASRSEKPPKGSMWISNRSISRQHRKRICSNSKTTMIILSAISWNAVH